MGYINKFIILNKRIWKGKKTITDTKESIFIPEEADAIYSDMVRYITAKAISEKTGYQIIRLVKQQENIENKRVAESFGIKTIFISSSDPVGNIIKIIAFIKTLFCMLRCRTGEMLLRYEFKETLIGKDIYDKMIREQERNSIEKLSISTDFKNIYEGIFLYYRLKVLYKQFPPRYILLGEMAYFLDIYRTVGQAAGARIIRASVMLREERNDVKVGFIHSAYKQLLKENWDSVENIDYNQYVEDYFTRFFRGNSELSWIKNMNQGKRELEKEEFYQRLKIDPNKKNIFIMAHSLSDAPHCSESMLYKDYYTALKETIKIAAHIDNVNWILKVHPSFRNYPGTNGNELIKGCKNIVLFDDAFDNKILYQMADAIITVQGTIGIEASALGIPVIVTGKAWYSTFGFTINAFSEEMYKSVLKKLNKIHKLSKDKMLMARKVFCAYLLGYNTATIDKDELGKALFDNMIATATLKKKNEFIVEWLCQYMRQSDLRKSYIYQKSVDIVDMNRACIKNV